MSHERRSIPGAAAATGSRRTPRRRSIRCRARYNLAQLLQPVAISGASNELLRELSTRRNLRVRGVRMQRLQRIDQHAGDVAARLQDMQRPLRHVGQRIGLVRRDRVATPGCTSPTSRDRRRRSEPDACAWCGSAPAAPPASRPRCRTCGTRLLRVRRSRTAAARCRDDG